MNKVRISLPYKDKEVLFNFSDRNIGEIISPRKVDPVENVDEEINRVLGNPIGSKKMEDSVNRDTKVLLGKGRASPDSLIQAIKLAAQLTYSKNKFIY